jgi:hypothetical protein
MAVVNIKFIYKAFIEGIFGYKGYCISTVLSKVAVIFLYRYLIQYQQVIEMLGLYIQILTVQ